MARRRCEEAHAHIRAVHQRGEEPQDRHLLRSGPLAATALFKIQHEPRSVRLSRRLMTEITLKCITQKRNCLISQLFVSDLYLGNLSGTQQALQNLYSVHI